MINRDFRALSKLSYHYWKKNKKRSAKENWKLAQILLEKLKKRYTKDIT